MVLDGPDDKGEMFEKSGTIRYFVSPYPNEEAARAKILAPTPLIYH